MKKISKNTDKFNLNFNNFVKISKNYDRIFRIDS